MRPVQTEWEAPCPTGSVECVMDCQGTWVSAKEGKKIFEMEVYDSNYQAPKVAGTMMACQDTEDPVECQQKYMFTQPRALGEDFLERDTWDWEEVERALRGQDGQGFMPPRMFTGQVDLNLPQKPQVPQVNFRGDIDYQHYLTLNPSVCAAVQESQTTVTPECERVIRKLHDRGCYQARFPCGRIRDCLLVSTSRTPNTN